MDEASLETNGYTKLPSGLIIQWGLTSKLAGGKTHTISLPTVFPNACFSVSGQPTYNAEWGNVTDNDRFAAFNTCSKNSFKIESVMAHGPHGTRDRHAQSYYWQAIGY